jgi:hypothetical protein
MTKRLLLIGMALLSLVLLSAQPCSAQLISESAVLGIYDDQAMTQNHGVMDSPSKVVWLGFRIADPALFDGFTSLEFSIGGLQAFPAYIVEFFNNPTVILGTLAAPADTLTGSGGVDVAWGSCMPTTFLVGRVTLIGAPPTNHTLTILRRFPPANPNWTYPLAMMCDSPCDFCHYHLVPGAYILNPLVGIERASWTTVRELYR